MRLQYLYLYINSNARCIPAWLGWLAPHLRTPLRMLFCLVMSWLHYLMPHLCPASFTELLS